MGMRWRRVGRQHGSAPRPVFVETSVVVHGRAPDEVWAVIRPAASAVLLQEDVVQAFTVPGTGPGRGEQQCFVRVVGGRQVVEMLTITAEEPGRFAEAVDAAGEIEWRMRWDVVPVAEGTRLTARCWGDLPGATEPGSVASCRDGVQRGQEEYLARVRRVLAPRQI